VYVYVCVLSRHQRHHCFDVRGSLEAQQTRGRHTASTRWVCLGGEGVRGKGGKGPVMMPRRGRQGGGEKREAEGAGARGGEGMQEGGGEVRGRACSGRRVGGRGVLWCGARAGRGGKATGGRGAVQE